MFGSDIISDDTINALLNAEMHSLNPEECDVIGEIGNISMGAAATALHTLVKHEVQITTPQVFITTLNEISKQFERPCLLVEVEYLAGLEGANLFIVSEKDAIVIANLMLGREAVGGENTIGELELSAIGEAMNQMMGSSATAMSTVFSQRIDISPPSVDFITIEDKTQKSQSLSADEKIVQTKFRMSVGDLIDSYIMVLSDITFAKEMVRKLIDGQRAEITEFTEKAAADSMREKTEDVLEETQSIPSASAKSAEAASGEPLPQVEVQPMQFASFEDRRGVQEGGNTQAASRNIEFLQDIPLHVAVRLGYTRMTIKDVLALGKGSVIELDRLAGEDVDLLVNGKLVAKGEVVVIEENFAFRIKKIVSPMERIKDL